MNKIKIAVLGGDNRELILLETLGNIAGYAVYCFGQVKDALPQSVIYCASLQDALINADVLILPMLGVSDKGAVYNAFGQFISISATELDLLQENAIIISGIAGKYLTDICVESGRRLITTAETDAIAVPNSIPTAEAAICLAIKNSQETINGSKTLVLGYGRVGRALALRMRALGSDVSVANRGEALCAKADKDGYDIVPWESFSEFLPEYDYIFNTVPVLILTSAYLKKIRNDALLIDLASMPGGIDKNAAAGLGLNYIHALGLPGKFSPVSAGKILAATYPHIINEMYKGEQSCVK